VVNVRVLLVDGRRSPGGGRGPRAPAGRRADGHPHARNGRHRRDRRAAAARPAPEGIVLTTFQADEQVMSALRAGADGFLLKDTPPEEIVNAIRLVATGDAMLSPSVTRTLLAHFSDPQATERRRAAAQRLATLTDRERQVAVAIGSGASNAEVGASLFLSEATVKAHVSRLFTKLDVTNRVQISIAVHDADQS